MHPGPSFGLPSLCGPGPVRWPRFLLAASLALALPGAQVMRVGGTGAGLGTLKVLAAAFEATHPGIPIEVVPSLGSSGGIKALLNGALDLAVTSRPPNPEEAQRGASGQPYATTPFAFIVNAGVKATDITPAELERIHRGELSQWPSGGRIRLVLRPPSDSDTLLVAGLSKDMPRAMAAAQALPDRIQAVTDQESAEAVRTIPGALGGATLAQIVSEHLPMPVLTYQGVAPTLRNLARGTYPLAKTLHLITAGTPPARIRAFLRFLRSPRGMRILTSQGNLPLPAAPPRP